MIFKKKKLGKIAVIALSFCFLMQISGILSDSQISPKNIGNEFLENIADETPTASDTVIVKNWEAIETITSWWDGNWQNRRKITITEPDLMDRDRDPVDVYLTFVDGEARVNSIRILYFRENDSTWIEVDSQVWNATLNGALTHYLSCTVTFFVDIKMSDTDYYYVYFDPTYSTAPSYTDHIDVQGVNSGLISDDSGGMPTVEHLPTSTNYTNSDAFEIIVDGDTASPQAIVCLVDTMRAESDWGGPSNSIIRAEYDNADTLDIGGDVWISVGEMALDPLGINIFDGALDRCNVGPDNVAEAWDGNGAVKVLDDGPLFTRINIQTTDGAYAHFGDWYRNSIYSTANDFYPGPDRGSGAHGYVKYNITYTFYYYGLSTFAKIEMDITALPQRGFNTTYPLSGYTADTHCYFKNFGDWPHLMQIVDASDAFSSARQNMKSWYGSKYGLYSEPNGLRRRDYPLEPWSCWWDDGTGTDPSIGMFAITEGIGWEVTSLAVTGIGENTLLQQILPEGHQGDAFELVNGTTLEYDYYVLTHAHGTNYTETRDVTRRMNDPLQVQVTSNELYTNNALVAHVNDLDGVTASDATVYLFNDTSGLLIDSAPLDANGNYTNILLPDGDYRLLVNFTTANLGNIYTIVDDTFTLDHLVNRTTYKTYNSNMANVSFYAYNWARNNELINVLQVNIKNSTSGAIVERNFTWNGYVGFRLFTNGTTVYDIEVIYGGLNRTVNVSSFVLNTSKTIDLGVQIETTAITIQSQDTSVVFGSSYTVDFYLHKSVPDFYNFTVDSMNVSSQFESGYWTEGVDFTWSNIGNNITRLILLTGSGTQLDTAGFHKVFIYAINSTVETAVDKLFILVDEISTDISFTLNDSVTSQVQVYRGEDVSLEIDYSYLSNGTDITDGTVNYTLNSVETNIPYDGGNLNYTEVIDTSALNFGTYVVSIEASKPNYEDKIASFIISVQERPTSLILSSPGNVFFGENFSIQATLIDIASGTGINAPLNITSYDNATGLINGWVTGGTNGVYNIIFDSDDFAGLGSYTIDVEFDPGIAPPYYQFQFRQINVTLVERDTTLSYTPVGSVAYGDIVTIDLDFNDAINGSGIDGATVECNLTHANNTLGNGGYQVIIDSDDLVGGIGTHWAGISLNWSSASEPFYKNRSVKVRIVVNNRPTQITYDPPTGADYGEIITFNLIFSDALNGSRLYGAGNVAITPNITGVGASINIDTYDITVDTSQLASYGTFYVGLTVEWIGGAPYYLNNSVAVKVVVSPRGSSLSLDKEGNVQFGENITINALFEDAVNGSGIPILLSGVSVTLNESVTIINQTGGPGDFTFIIDSGQLSLPGTYTINVTMTWTGSPFYVNQTRSITVTVSPRNTQLYATETFGDKTWGTNFTVNAFYIDVINGSAISNTSGYLTIGLSCATVPEVNSSSISFSFNVSTGAWEFNFNASLFQNPGQTYLVTLEFNWSSTDRPFYINRVVSFNLKIVQAPTSLTLYPGGQTATAGNYHALTFFFSNDETGQGINLTGDGDPLSSNVVISSSDARWPDLNVYDASNNLSTNATDGFFFVYINITSWSETNIHAFTVSVYVTNYDTIVNFAFSLILVPQVSTAEVQSINSGHLGETINITLFYHDGSGLGGQINASQLNISYQALSGYWTYGVDYNYTYTGVVHLITIYTGFAYKINNSGSHSFYINVSAPTYESQNVRVSSVNVDPIPTDIPNVLFNGTLAGGPIPTYSTVINEGVNITCQYYDTFNTIGIDSATVTLSPSSVVNFMGNGTTGYYQLVLNTAEYGLGTHQLTISAVKGNYSQAIQQIELVVNTVSTSLSVEIDDQAVTTKQIYWGDSINISAVYTDTNHSIVLDNTYSPTITVSGGVNGTVWPMAWNGNNWSVVINSDEIGTPAPSYPLIILASLTNYSAKTTGITIQILTVPTVLNCYNSSGSLDTDYSVYWGELIYLSLVYTDTNTPVNLTGAIIGNSTPWLSYNTTGDFYNFAFNSSQFGGPSSYNLVMTAELANHSTSLVSIDIDVMAIPTLITTQSQYTVTWGDNLTVFIEYNETLTGAFVAGAIVVASNGYVVENAANYSIEFNSTDIGVPGFYLINIEASKDNHTKETETISIEIVPIQAELISYEYNGPEADQLSVTWGDNLVFTCIYRIVPSNISLNPAGIDLHDHQGIGTAVVQPSLNITVTINSTDIGAAGIHDVRVTTTLANHTSASLRLTVEILAINTEMVSYEYGGAAKSQFSVTYGQDLVFTAIYRTLSATPLSPSYTSLGAYDGVGTVVIEPSNNLTITINSTDIGDVGVYTVYVFAGLQNHTNASVGITVAITEIQTKLSLYDPLDNPVSQITLGYGEILNFTGLYQTTSNVTLVPTVVSIGAYDPFATINNGPNNFTIEINSTDIGTPGIYVLQVSAGLLNHQNLTKGLTVVITPTPTGVQVIVDGVDITASGQAEINNTANFTVLVYYFTTSPTLANITNTASVRLENETNYWNMTVSGDGYFIEIDSDDLALANQYSFTVICQNSTTETQNFRFYIFPRDISTELLVEDASFTPVVEKSTIFANWSDVIVFNCRLNDTFNGIIINNSATARIASVGTAIVPGSAMNATTGYWTFTLDTSNLPVLVGGVTLISFRANLTGYELASFTFNLFVNRKPTNVSVKSDGTSINSSSVIQVVYSDYINLTIDYNDLLSVTAIDPDNATIQILVSGFVLDADSLNSTTANFTLNPSVIGLSADTTPQATVNARAANYSDASLSFVLQILSIPSEVLVFKPSESLLEDGNTTIAVTWNDTLYLQCKLKDNITSNNLTTAAFSTAIGGQLFNAYQVNLDTWEFFFNTSALEISTIPVSLSVTITGSSPNYQPSSFNFILQILEIQTKINYTVNGLAVEKLPTDPNNASALVLGRDAIFLVNYSTTDNVSIDNAIVQLQYINDLTKNVTTLNASNNVNPYIFNVPLSLNVFYGIPKIFLITASKDNHTTSRADDVITIHKIKVDIDQPDEEDPKTDRVVIQKGQSHTLKILLNNTITELAFTDNVVNINITVESITDDRIQDIRMTNHGDGSFTLDLGQFTGVGSYVFQLTLEIPARTKFQYDIEQVITITIEVVEVTEEGIPAWVFYIVLGALIGVSVWFILYQMRFKYPPIIRKIHDLERSIHRGKAAAKIKVQKVSSREENIYGEFAKVINEYSFLQTSDSKFAAKAKGYAPVGDESLALEFGLESEAPPALEAPPSLEKLPTEGPKKIKAPPKEAVGLKPPVTPPKPVGPAPPGVPKLTPPKKLPKVPPVSPPKPVAKAPAKPRAKPVPKIVPSVERRVAVKPPSHEGLYAELVKLEQKKYKAQRSIRDLTAKKEKGILSEDEYLQYKKKFDEALKKINESINDLRRQLMNF